MYPTMIRQVLKDNSWHLQCPECRQFVPIDLDIMEGRSPFPTHVRWSDSYILREDPEPICPFVETYNWREQMPPTGVSALGPL